MTSPRTKTRVAVYWLAATAAILAVLAWLQLRHVAPSPWSEAEIAVLRSLWIGSLPDLPPDSSNAVADDPRAAGLGYQLFFSTGLSPSDAISCATCHRPELHFTDGLEQGRGIGASKRNTRSIVAAAYSPWQYWDGRRDSLWAQALSPIEDPAEHGGSREHAVDFVATTPGFRRQYESIFGKMPDLADRAAVDSVFANIGKAIAAYERLLMPGPSRFDDYVEAVIAGDRVLQDALFSNDERAGLRLFIGRGACTQCHNGPLFTNHEFHNTGVISFPGEVPDKGRASGLHEVLADPFNCLGEFSDDETRSCAELDFARSGPELLGTFQSPSLRNLEHTEPYMHKGQLRSLAEVLQHYNAAPPAMIGHNEAKPLGLSNRELRQLEDFLRSLAAPLATPEKWLRPPAAAAAE